jgi:hypothetical protein
VGAGEQRDPPSRAEHAAHLVQGLERLGEQVERGEAARGIEGLVAERQGDGVPVNEAEVGDRGLAGLAHRPLQHRPRPVQAHREAFLADRAREVA